MPDDGIDPKKALILKAACALFSERGYAAATTEALTERLSISKTAIYSHFRSKSDILATICAGSIRISAELAERVADGPGDPRAKLGRLAHDFTRIVIENQDSIAVAAREMAALPAAAQAEIRRMQGNFDRHLTAIIRAGIACGQFAPADPGLAALAIAGMIIWVHSWYRPDGRLTAAEIADGMEAAALRMVGAAG